MVVVDIILLVTCGLLLVPFSAFWIECGLSLMPRRRQANAVTDSDAAVWIVIPAHNEAAVISSTLNSIRKYSGTSTKILVIADNCTDDTTLLALAQGCYVIERCNRLQRGKGFALQFAFNYLRKHHEPAVVVILDADCQVGKDTIPQIASLAVTTNRPVQALNLSTSHCSSSQLSTLSELGFRFKNLIRPLGLLRIGMPCQLMGTGIAIPWPALSGPHLLADDLAEDMQLGIDLAVAGHPTLFHPEVEISSHLPQNQSGFMTQRTRWEQGHLQTSLKQIPVLLKQSLRQRRFELFVLALDLMILPFSLLMLSWVCLFAITLAGWLLGASVIPFSSMALAGVFTAMTIFTCWLMHCRSRIPFSSLLLLPFYAVRKAPIYFSFFTGRGARHWIRTERL